MFRIFLGQPQNRPSFCIPKQTIGYLKHIAFGIAFLLIFINHASASFYLLKTDYSALPRWSSDKHGLALSAFNRSCTEILRRHSNEAFGLYKQTGKVYDWQRICLAAKNVYPVTDQNAKQFFEKWFQPFAVKDSNYQYGLFTGYYLPIMHGSLTKTSRFNIPVYGLPYDLLQISTTMLNIHAPIRTITRQVIHRKLYPYPDRAAIDQGAIAKQTPIIAWVDNKIDLFFAQIQGSAFVLLPNKQRLLLGYAGHNGRPYVAIGKILVDAGELSKATVSMQSIRTWLGRHPHAAIALLNQNPSYVFFRVLDTPDPLGTEHVPLTPARSLAVDPAIIPLGAPLWLNTVIPLHVASNEYQFYRHLMIAQDTGGAIKGSIRGDVYWGELKNANFLAGNMKSPGEYWLFLPKNVS